MKNQVKILWVAVICCFLANLAKADLLGVNPSFPQINFINTSTTALTYDPVAQILTINALPFEILFSESDTGTLIASNSLAIQLDTDGNLVSGTNGFVLTGQFTHVVDGVTNSYSGVLLQGDVLAFGYLYSGVVNQFDFSVQVTGGELQTLFNCADDLGVTLTSEASTFTGSFTNAFNGAAKGECGPEDLTPPTITCPPLSQVVTTPAVDANGNPGFIITYPDPVVTDNCDPEPSIYCDTASGSFVYLNAGDQLTVTCYGIDASFNYSDCSFTVTMGVTNSAPCMLAFNNPGCTPTTLDTDTNECYATYAFAAPMATNCSSQYFTATATALSEAGAAIVLKTLTNGLLQGQFPRTLTTNGDVITFTDSDGRGNSVVQPCVVYVNDRQPPTIECVNQSATFKPILTNNLSCIEADFNNPCIQAGNYIWFSSVIRPNSFWNQGGTFTVHITDQTIQLAVDDTNITLAVPDAYVYFSNGVATATTIFTNNEWVTFSSLNCGGNTFAAGLAWQVPFNLNNLTGGCWGRDAGCSQYRRHVNPATWSARFAVDTANVSLQWQWGGVVESKLSTNYNALCVKPVDDNHSSCWKNNDPAGACEGCKSFLVCGARGNGICYQGGWQVPDCTGILSAVRPCNLGVGILCEGAVNFTTPSACDNCGNPVKVTCNPPSGTVFGPGDQTITCTAVDAGGNTNECSFTLTVLAPLQVVFDAPACDNLVDNTSDPDKGYTDFNCPDSPSTFEQVTCFRVGQCVLHEVRLLDCNGNDVTSSLANCVTVHLDVTERCGSYANSALVSDVPQNYNFYGCAGSLMVPCNGEFLYNLNTAGYPSHTVNTSTFFRSCVWVDYNSAPGVVAGMEDVLLQSQ